MKLLVHTSFIGLIKANIAVAYRSTAHHIVDGSEQHLRVRIAAAEPGAADNQRGVQWFPTHGINLIFDAALVDAAAVGHAAVAVEDAYIGIRQAFRIRGSAQRPGHYARGIVAPHGVAVVHSRIAETRMHVLAEKSNRYTVAFPVGAKAYFPFAVTGRAQLVVGGVGDIGAQTYSAVFRRIGSVVVV